MNNDYRSTANGKILDSFLQQKVALDDRASKTTWRPIISFPIDGSSTMESKQGD